MTTNPYSIVDGNPDNPNYRSWLLYEWIRSRRICRKQTKNTRKESKLNIKIYKKELKERKLKSL